MRRLVLCLLLLSVPSVALATTVLCYGDSITIGYPSRLQQLRPDLEVYGAGLSGDTTANAERLLGELAARHYDVVVILLGINDPLDGSLSDPRVSFARTQRLARRARAIGATVFLLTLTPETKIRPPRPDFDFNTFAYDLSRLILDRYGHRRSGIRAADLRDRFTLLGWDSTSDDGLHPNTAGVEVMATFVATLIP